jgi:hypothetical protein
LTLPRVGDWLHLFSWSPRAESLAWSPDPSRLNAIDILSVDHQGPSRTIALKKSGINSAAVWSADGRALLYWGVLATGSRGTSEPLNFSLTRWLLPNGPAETDFAPIAVRFVEGALPPPASDAAGTLFASLLGTPDGGLNQVILYARGMAPRAVKLPGEPRAVVFAPAGSRFVAIWTPPYGQGFASHAALVDAKTGQTQELGAAVAAYWIHSAVSRL